MKLVEIAEYGDEIEAEFARAALQDAGIECELWNANSSHLYGSGLITGGVRLAVKDIDELPAREILKEIKSL